MRSGAIERERERVGERNGGFARDDRTVLLGVCVCVFFAKRDTTINDVCQVHVDVWQ